MIEYKLEKVKDNIFHCIIEDTYELGMTFCRLQEFYESPYKEIKGKKFNLLDFMSLYVKERKECFFSYPLDWCGFNIPDNVFRKFETIEFDDINKYDLTIADIYDNILKEIGDNRFYLIASEGSDKVTLNHEICHAFYYLDKNYKKITDNLISENINSKTKTKLEKALKDLGYKSKVYNDEIQAYLSTGYDCLLEFTSATEERKLEKISKLFVDNFKNFNN